MKTVTIIAKIQFGNLERLEKGVVSKMSGMDFIQSIIQQESNDKLYICLFAENKNGFLEEVKYPRYKRIQMERTRNSWTPYQKFNGGFLLVNKNQIWFPCITGRNMVLITDVGIAIEKGMIIGVGKLTIPALIPVTYCPLIESENLMVML